ncbi:MAG: hypothetical protein ACYDDO_09290 [Acidiferrobacterales bacterium]
MEDGLKQLSETWRGELARQSLAGRVLVEFAHIQRFRQQKCPWRRIAEAMGVNPESLRRAFRAIHQKIEAGLLIPPGPEPRSKPATPVPRPPVSSAPPPPGAGGSKSGKSADLEKLEEAGITFE